MARGRLTWILLGLALIFGSAAVAQTYPSHDDVYVNDFAHILTPTESSRIRTALAGLYDQTGIEAVVVTLPTMLAYGHHGEIEPFATGLFNAWGVGNAGSNNGVMLLVAQNDRQMRIEVGSGYGASMDAQMQSIIDRRILPEFRNGRFGPGISAGVDDLVSALLRHAGKAPAAGFLDPVRRGIDTMSGTMMAVLAAVGAGALALATRLYQLWRRSRPRLCPVDGTRMDLMSEDSDDAKLQQGQTTEERLGSVDYDVWHCPKCRHVTIESYRRWFTRYGACRSCNFRTLEGTTTILTAATTSHSGLKRIDYHCHNCSADYSVTKTIPQVSDSDSGRSSFGGGSSSGGGASGRW